MFFKRTRKQRGRRTFFNPALEAAFRNIRRERGKRKLQYGHEREWQVLEAFAEVPNAALPLWILRIRKATQEEDMRGVDIVIETTDAGKLFLQVKSGSWRAARFHQRAAGTRREYIKIFVCRPEMSKQEIRTAVLALAEEAYRALPAHVHA